MPLLAVAPFVALLMSIAVFPLAAAHWWEHNRNKAIVVSLLSGLRTEEARALRWDHVVAWVSGQWVPVAEAGFDHEQVAVFVWRAERAGGDTKTPESRRTLALPGRCGRITGWCSRRRWGRRWMITTCGGCSG